MIQFNELKIIPDGTKLIIDASVEDLSYYTNIYIDSVAIDNQDTYIPSGVSSNPLYNMKIISHVHLLSEEIEANPEDYVGYSVSKNVKNIRLELSVSDFTTPIKDLNSNLFFVYVMVKGTPSPDTPCGMDNQSTVGVVFNLIPLYNMYMQYFKELEATCSIPKNLINSILKLKGLELALMTGNYFQAVTYWNKYFKEQDTINTPNCSCRNG